MHRRKEAIEETISPIDGFTYRLFIERDEDADSPRDWDNLGTIWHWHRRYDLGDGNAPGDVLESGNTFGDIARYMEKEYNAAIVLPVYLYDHSGLRISTSAFSCPWDSGMVGIIWVSRADVLKEYGGKIITKKRRQVAISRLVGEVETYDQYLSGEVYGYIIDRFDAEDEDAEPEELDSCWGFYGYKHAREEGAEMLQYCATGKQATQNAQRNTAKPYLMAEAHGQKTLALI